MRGFHDARHRPGERRGDLSFPHTRSSRDAPGFSITLAKGPKSGSSATTSRVLYRKPLYGISGIASI